MRQEREGIDMAYDYKDVRAEQYPPALPVDKMQDRLTFLALVLVLFGIVPLQGLPGLLIFNLFVNTLIAALPGAHTWCRFYAASLVPLTLCITFLWPLSLPVGYVIAFKKCQTYPKLAQVLIWLAITVLWGALLSVGLCLVGARAAASLALLEQAVTLLTTSTSIVSSLGLFGAA